MGYRILVINWQDISNPLGGGAEVHLHEIFKRIAVRGHEVTLLCCGYKDAKSSECIDGIEVVRAGSRHIFNFVVPGAYARLSREKQFDIVVDDINKIPFYTPAFVRKPLIGIVHHLFGDSIFIEAPYPKALYVNMTERLIPSMYRRMPIAVVSNSTKEELIDKGFKANKLHLIFNGVNLDLYQPRHSERSQSPLIGYLGRIKKYKSVDDLLRAFAMVLADIPEVKLLIMGDGDYLPKLKRLAVDLKLSNAVTFTGAASESAKIENLNRIWFSVNPSPKEGWGLTVIESNACGVPVIAADSPGLRDSVVNGSTGLLYRYGDCGELADKMRRLINDQEQLRVLSKNSIQWAQNFSWDNSADKMLALIEKTIEEYTEDLYAERRKTE